MDRKNSGVLSGRTAALVYPFDLEATGRFRDKPAPDTIYIAHQALWALGADVLILDIQACHRRMISESDLDFVLEISGFATNSELEGLLGMMCAANRIPYFPTNRLPRTIAADKLIAKRFAQRAGLRTPKTYSQATVTNLDSRQALIKPICGGESLGIRTFDPDDPEVWFQPDTFVEEFIDGVDTTVLMIRHPTSSSMEILAAFTNQDQTSERVTTNATKKRDHYLFGQSIRTRTPVTDAIPSDVSQAILAFVELIGCPPICRLDFRQSDLDAEEWYFLEINTDPTLGANELWYTPVKRWCLNNEMFHEFDEFDRLPIHNSAKVIAFLIAKNHI